MPATSQHNNSLQVILVDLLDDVFLKSLKEQLTYVSSLLASSSRWSSSSGHIALCSLIRDASLKVQLQVLVRPGCFAPKAFHQAIARLSASTVAEHDSKSQCIVLRTLIQYLCQQEQYKSANKVISFVANSFPDASGMIQFLQAAEKQKVSVRFRAFPLLDGPSPQGMRTQLASFTAAMMDISNATLTVHSADKWAVQHLCLQWLQELLEPFPRQLTLDFPDSFGLKSLNCCLTSELNLLGPVGEPCKVCPCHSLPLHQSLTSAWERCSLSGCSIAAASCSISLMHRRVGHHTFQMASSDPWSSNTERGDDDMRLCVLQAVKVQQVSDSLTYGTPSLLYPWSSEVVDFAAMEQNENAFAALCKALVVRNELLVGSSHSEFCSSGATQQAPAFYVLFPAADCNCMLVKRLACIEEILPVAAVLPKLPAPPEEMVQAMTNHLDSIASPIAHLQLSSRAAGKVQECIANSIFPQQPWSLQPAGPVARAPQPATAALRRSKRQPASNSAEKSQLVLPPAPTRR